MQYHHDNYILFTHVIKIPTRIFQKDIVRFASSANRINVGEKLHKCIMKHIGINLYIMGFPCHDLDGIINNISR